MIQLFTFWTHFSLCVNGCVFITVIHLCFQISSLVNMGRHFGDLARVRHVITYSLSPFEQRAFANYFSKGIPNVWRRFTSSFFKVAPREFTWLWYILFYVLPLTVGERCVLNMPCWYFTFFVFHRLITHRSMLVMPMSLKIVTFFFFQFECIWFSTRVGVNSFARQNVNVCGFLSQNFFTLDSQSKIDGIYILKGYCNLQQSGPKTIYLNLKEEIHFTCSWFNVDFNFKSLQVNGHYYSVTKHVLCIFCKVCSGVLCCLHV